MRDPRFIHIGYTMAPGIDIDAVDKAVESEVLDWLRYAPCCYLAWTASNTEMVCRAVVRVVGLASSVFVTAVSYNDAFGSLPPWAWEWLRRDRGLGPLKTYDAGVLPILPPPRFPK